MSKNRDSEAEAMPANRRAVPTDESSALLAAIVSSSDDAIISKDLDGYITSWNAAAERIFGYAEGEAIGRQITLIIPEHLYDEETQFLDRIRAGERIENFDTIRRRKDGTLIPISLTISPVRGKDGRIIGASKIARDISERKQIEQAQLLLSHEVNHRSKNLLAVVQSIIRYTVVHSPPQDFLRRMDERLQALSANQDLLIESAWRGVPIAALIRTQLGHIDNLPIERVSVKGESLALAPAATQAVGIAVHELASNAVKFGALSSGQGRVAVHWHLEPNKRGQELVISWSESGGPIVAAPDYAGFGATIIEHTGQSVGGRVVTRYAPTGLTWELRAPAASMIEGRARP
jgi:PAS domain S-box-containing protein